MKRIFLDANIIIDLVNRDASNHENIKTCMRIVRTYFGKPLISPFTLLITNYLTGKFTKNKTSHVGEMKLLFSGFEITSFESKSVISIFENGFHDLEDSLQYECALSAKAHLIITKDIHDFVQSKIPVVHPFDFVIRFKEWFEDL